MRLLYLLKLSLGIVVLCLFTAQTAFADFRLLDAIEEFGEQRYLKSRPTRLQYKGIKFHPTLTTGVNYDSNILLEANDAREDVIYTVQPGVIIEIPINTHQIAIGYEADMEFFSKSRHSNQNDQNQNFFALADFKFPNWYINILERFSETSSRAGTTFTSRIPRFDQSIHPKIGYRWKRLVFEGGYRHFVRDFRRTIDGSLDFRLSEWTGVIFYDLFARLKALADFQVSQIEYNDAPNRQGTFYQSRLGLEGEVLPNVFVKARMGGHFRNYHENSEPDWNNWVATLSVEYAWRENIRFRAGYDRVPLEATFQDVNYFARNLLSAGVDYHFTEQWMTYHLFKYYRDDYEERAVVGGRSGFRHDDHLGYETGMRYSPQEWLELELSYEYLRRDSNFSTFDYTDHRVSLTSTLSY